MQNTRDEVARSFALPCCAVALVAAAVYKASGGAVAVALALSAAAQARLDALGAVEPKTVGDGVVAAVIAASWTGIIVLQTREWMERKP